MNHFLSRTERIIGTENIQKINNSKVVILGIGGVGGFATEAIARSGVGTIVLVDKDVVDITNINRQIIATNNTIGREKVEVMRERILDINPKCQVKTHRVFIDDSNIKYIIEEDVDYVIDAIDTVSSKISVAVWCSENSIHLISSMGTGNKIDPTKLKVTDIFKTNTCPLAKVMRRELRKMNIKKLKVVYSEEEPMKPIISPEEANMRKVASGSVIFVPSVAGLIIGGEVIRNIMSS